ncbi:hypothetical protein HHI36_011082 [Cryptolaemus montrouzieri]|uniref:Uncharacterized protein n=1 Tax=Cryptolaemus montrouzieri TaxID=559131 RepID=A0ABD2MKN5_9CUCU
MENFKSHRKQYSVMSNQCLFKIAPKDSVEIAKNESHQKRQSSCNLKNLNIHVPSKIRFKEKCRYVEYLDKGITCNLVNAEGLNIYLEEKEIDLVDDEDQPSCSFSTTSSVQKFSRAAATPTYIRMLNEIEKDKNKTEDQNKRVEPFLLNIISFLS